MTDTAPAYAQALDQLRAERDAAVARADATERQWAAIAQTPDGGWHFAYQRAAAQIAEVTAERDTARARLDEWQSTARFAHEDHPAVAQLRAELDTARSRLTMTTRDLDAAERAVVALKAIAHAIVNAVAKENP